MKTSLRHAFVFFLLLLCSSPVQADGYLIGEEDMLQISVWGNTDLSVHLPVRPDGMISMPLVGDIKAAGVTPQELKKSLEKELARYVKAPVVSVMVTAVNSFKVYVLGDGASRIQGPGGAAANAGGGAAAPGVPSGIITLRRNTTLMQLLAQFGSLSDVDLKNTYLLRSGRMLEVNFEKLVVNGDVSQDVNLEPNDTIFLPMGFNSRIRVTGAVRSPGVFPFARGMTALDAVLVAGGFTEFANQNSVMIVRTDGRTARNIEVALKDVMKGELAKNVALTPGDIVIVRPGIF
jgi:polysaccharide biosynthesis/export protein